MARTLFSFLFFLLLSILIVGTVHAVGIQAPPLSERTIVFEPNTEKSFVFNLVNSPYIQSYKRAGILDPYVTLDDPAQDSGSRSVTAHIRLPESLDPGKYEIMIGGREINPAGGGTVGAVAAIESRITVISLYPGIYPEYSLSTADVGLGQTAEFKVNVHNYGTQAIQAAHATVDIYDSENNKITTINTDIQTIGSNADMALTARFNAGPAFKQGQYKAVAKLICDGKEQEHPSEAGFRIGSLNIKITGWTKEVVTSSTNKFKIDLESDWASPINNVYAKIYTPDGKTLKTPNLDINKFQTATLDTYWETGDMKLGKATVDIEVFYESTSVRKTVDITLVDKLSAPPGANVEEPGRTGNSTLLYVVIGVVALLILVNLFFLFKNRGNNTQQNLRPPNL